MPSCPDCGEERMTKHTPYYVCTRCGLSFKPTEIQKARDRAKRELQQIMTRDEEREVERKRRKQRDYRRWFEGRQDD